MSDSIWGVCVSVRFAMSSSIALACSLIAFALNCFAVSFFCYFVFVYSADMNDIMFCRILVAAGLASHSCIAASNSPVLLK
jgi:hypothetical protein